MRVATLSAELWNLGVSLLRRLEDILRQWMSSTNSDTKTYRLALNLPPLHPFSSQLF